MRLPATLELRPGQVLEALVLRAGSTTQDVLLGIGGRVVSARAEIPLHAGQRLLLSVRETGSRVLLQILPAEVRVRPDSAIASAMSAASTRTQLASAVTGNVGTPMPPEPRSIAPGGANTIAAALRSALPRAIPVTDALRLLTLLDITTTPSGARLLPPEALRAIGALLTAVPRRSELTTANSLRKAIHETGHLLEGRLAGMTVKPDGEPFERDRKALLMKLRAVLASAPRPATPGTGEPSAAISQAKEAVDGALARIHTQQLAHLARQGSESLPLMVELPFRQGEVLGEVALRIEQDRNNGGNSNSHGWQVVMEVELDPPLGRLQARVGLREGVVSIGLRTLTEATAELARSRLQELRVRLEEDGLSVGVLSSVHGRLPAADEPRAEVGTLLGVSA